MCVITTHTRTHIIAANGRKFMSLRIHLNAGTCRCCLLSSTFAAQIKKHALTSRANNRMICIIFHDARRQTICARNCVKDLRGNKFNLHKETGSFAFLIIRSADDVVWRACIWMEFGNANRSIRSLNVGILRIWSLKWMRRICSLWKWCFTYWIGR